MEVPPADTFQTETRKLQASSSQAAAGPRRAKLSLAGPARTCRRFAVAGGSSSVRHRGPCERQSQPAAASLCCWQEAFAEVEFADYKEAQCTRDVNGRALACAAGKQLELAKQQQQWGTAASGSAAAPRRADCAACKAAAGDPRPRTRGSEGCRGNGGDGNGRGAPAAAETSFRGAGSFLGAARTKKGFGSCGRRIRLQRPKKSRRNDRLPQRSRLQRPKTSRRNDLLPQRSRLQRPKKCR